MRALIIAGFALIVGIALVYTLERVQLTATLIDEFHAFPEHQAEERVTRTKGFRGYHAQTQHERTAYLTSTTKIREELGELRERCSREVRPDRRSTFPAALRCLQSELELLTDLANEEQAFLRIDPGGTPEQKTHALNTQKSLIEAIDALSAGIDADIYQDMQALIDARTTLLDRYRAPAWAAMLPLQVARGLQWTSILIETIDGIDITPLSEEEITNLGTAIICLESVERQLLRLQELENRSEEAVIDELDKLYHCINSIVLEK